MIFNEDAANAMPSTVMTEPDATAVLRDWRIRHFVLGVLTCAVAWFATSGDPGHAVGGEASLHWTDVVPGLLLGYGYCGGWWLLCKRLAQRTGVPPGQLYLPCMKAAVYGLFAVLVPWLAVTHWL